MACLGHTQYRWNRVIQVSDLGGRVWRGYVVDLRIRRVGENALPCDDRRWTFWPIAPMLAVLAAVLGYWLRSHVSGDYHVTRAEGRLLSQID